MIKKEEDKNLKNQKRQKAKAWGEAVVSGSLWITSIKIFITIMEAPEGAECSKPPYSLIAFMAMWLLTLWFANAADKAIPPAKEEQ